MDTHNNPILFVMGTIIMFFSLGYMILMLWICKKSFSFTILLIINVQSWNEKIWIPITISVLFVIGIIIMFFSLGYTILMLWICKKSISFHHFPYNSCSFVEWENLDTRNNLHSFCYGHCNHVLLLRIHDIDALDLQEKLFIQPFYL